MSSWALALVACGLVLAGCGDDAGDLKPSDDRQLLEQRARDTARQFSTALGSGDGAAVCELLVSEIRDGMSDCAADWSESSSGLGRVTGISLLEDDYARATFTQADYYDLRLEDGAWHIDPRH